MPLRIDHPLDSTNGLLLLQLEGDLPEFCRKILMSGSGVSEGEIMTLCGWKTRTMFDRYNIIDEADLAEVVAKRV